ncbi:MAG TPA: bifunctional diguanylate cyclase/phosphodiesterase [Solirubrobacteraceae bacterium]|nr:bifunctional diguanylate cyclase/phosphodiesterase [Solirubrobacteraceae bacterium]
MPIWTDESGMQDGTDEASEQTTGGAPQGPPVVPGRAAGRPRSRVSGLGVVVAILCVVAGLAATVLLARERADNDATAARRSFDRSSGELANTVRLAIQQQEGLAVGAGAFWSSHPRASGAELDEWARAGHILRRYPGLDQVGFVALVPVAEPAPQATKAAATATTSTAGAGTSTAGTGTSTAGAATGTAVAAPSASAATSPRTTPSRSHRYTCVTVAQLARRTVFSASSGLNYCSKGTVLLRARDSGATSYALVSSGHRQALVARVPLYRGNATPPGSPQRKALFLGWLHEQWEPTVVLRQALHGTSGFAVRLRHSRRSSHVVISSGNPQPGAPTSTAVVGTGWTMASFGTPIHTSVLDDGNARTILIAGVLVSLLLGGLVLVGTRVRRRRPRATPKSAGDERLYDPLTGLPNRALALDRAEWLIARSKRQPGLLVGALVIDIDWFADVTGKLGAAAGDQLLEIVAERLRRVVRGGDTVARLRDDSFVVLVEAVARGARLDFLAGRIMEALHKPFELDDFGPNFFVTASIGVAFGRYEESGDLLRDAQLAVDAAKSAGGDRFTLFNANMRAVIEGGGAFEAELNKGLEDGQFLLLYQPIYDLAGGRVAGMEALLHWEHPTRGMLPATDFIGPAEEMGLIAPIGRWMLEEACTRAAAWNVAGHRAGVSVSVSAKQLSRDGFLVDVRRALQQSGLEPRLLTLQMAEATVIGDRAAAGGRLQELKQLGVTIAIDDFGASGYAYHEELRQLPLDFLRVDRGSLAASDDEEYRSWLLEAILVVGRKYGLTVIAKEVETYQQMITLKDMGCPMVQGFFMGKPTAGDAVEGLFATQLPVAEGVPDGHVGAADPTGWVRAEAGPRDPLGSAQPDGTPGPVRWPR